MSKTTVRKALAEFDAAELRQLVFDLYAKSKEAKEILDFYAEPDIHAKLEEMMELADKETGRYRRRRFVCKISAVKALIKRFQLFEPGDDALARLRVHIIESFCANGSQGEFKTSLYEAVGKFTAETIEFLKATRLDEEYMPRIRKAVSDIRRRSLWRENPLSAELKKWKMED